MEILKYEYHKNMLSDISVAICSLSAQKPAEYCCCTAV